MKTIDFDLASLEISELAQAYIKYSANPDMNSVVRAVMPEIVKKFSPSKQEYPKLLKIAQRICGDIVRQGRI